VKTDSIFYQLFLTYPALFFELIGQPPELATAYEFKSVELKQTAFRIDGVFLPASTTSTRPVYFGEVQFQKDPLLYHRFFAEIFLYLRQNPTTPDWQGVLIYPQRGIEPDESRLYRSLLSSAQVQSIYLDELEATDEPSLGLGIIQLIVQPPARAGEQVRQLLQQLDREEIGRLSRREIIELIETIVVYKFPRLSRREIEAMLNLSELKQTRVYQEAKQEGREEGQQEGRQEGQLTLIVRQLTRRFGTLEPEVQAQVQELSLNRLEELGEALLDFSSAADLADWLQAHQ
jgi:predicted transposase/invertase (TIGR01784 family)